MDFTDENMEVINVEHVWTMGDESVILFLIVFRISNFFLMDIPV